MASSDGGQGRKHMYGRCYRPAGKLAEKREKNTLIRYRRSNDPCQCCRCRYYIRAIFQATH
jgi:hypothetical protein